MKRTDLDPNSEKRKSDHIELAARTQPHAQELSSQGQFYYEPLLSAHPSSEDLSKLKTRFINFDLGAPFWVSSMTGGTEESQRINHLLAKTCGQYQIPFALGSCRSLLKSPKRFADFDVKKWMGRAPLFANIGVAQLDQMLEKNELNDLFRMIDDLGADGLVVHINPLQEWLQPEGDRWKRSALIVLKEFLSRLPRTIPIVVKEVGQGIGPRSLRALMELPLSAIEFAGLGGTNFSDIEFQRLAPHLSPSSARSAEAWKFVGHTADEMANWVIELLKERMDWGCTNFIISGGVRTVFDGQALLNKLACPALIGQAFPYLQAAMNGERELEEFVRRQMMDLLMVRAFLWHQ